MYKAELARVGGESLANEDLVKKAEELGDTSAATFLESQLCRSLRKPKEAQAAACSKYLTLYASVPQAAVQTVLWEAAAKEAKKHRDS